MVCPKEHKYTIGYKDLHSCSLCFKDFSALISLPKLHLSSQRIAFESTKLLKHAKCFVKWLDGTSALITWNKICEP